MKKISIVAAAAIAMASVGAPAFAADAPATTPNPWVDCGIGAMIFPHTMVGAVISNVIWDYGVTGTTSAVSSPSTCEGSRVKVAAFINTNYKKLAAETAVGAGSSLAAMTELMACDSAVRVKVVEDVRAAMPAVMAQAGYSSLTETKKAEAYFNVVDKLSQTKYASACNMA